jgi:cytochrome c-type biogenesis protein CcmH/NrfG
LLKPNNVQNLLLLGKVNEKLKNTKQAMKYYEALLKLEPANMEARNAYEQLKKTQNNES